MMGKAFKELVSTIPDNAKSNGRYINKDNG